MIIITHMHICALLLGPHMEEYMILILQLDNGLGCESWSHGKSKARKVDCNIVPLKAG